MVSDEQLLLAARDGDGEAFAQFYRRHVSAIAAYLRRRVASPELAFDLTAETFAAAVTALSGFRPDRGSARGWLFAIAANELRQAWRHQQVADRARRRLALEPVVLDDEAAEYIEALCDEAPLTEALAALSEDERRAIEARVLDERDYPDIARELCCSPAVVRKRVSRGLHKLRETVEEQP